MGVLFFFLSKPWAKTDRKDAIFFFSRLQSELFFITFNEHEGGRKEEMLQRIKKMRRGLFYIYRPQKQPLSRALQRLSGVTNHVCGLSCVAGPERNGTIDEWFWTLNVFLIAHLHNLFEPLSSLLLLDALKMCQRIMRIVVAKHHHLSFGLDSKCTRPLITRLVDHHPIALLHTLGKDQDKMGASSLW